MPACASKRNSTQEAIPKASKSAINKWHNFEFSPPNFTASGTTLFRLEPCVHEKIFLLWLFRNGPLVEGCNSLFFHSLYCFLSLNAGTDAKTSNDDLEW